MLALIAANLISSLKSGTCLKNSSLRNATTTFWAILSKFQSPASGGLCSVYGVCCKSGRSSGTIAPSTGHTCRHIPQSIQVAKSIQYQSVPLTFLPGPSWMQATGQASTQSATPSQVLVTIVCGTVFSRKDLVILIWLGLLFLAYQD